MRITKPKLAFIVSSDKVEKFLAEMKNPTITAFDVVARNEAKLKKLKERSGKKNV